MCMDQELHFDEHSFSRCPKAVSQETCLTFQDFGSMHIQRKGRHIRRRLPEKIEWAFNDEMMKNVVLTYLERRFFLRPIPGATNEERLARINAHGPLAVTYNKFNLDARIDAHKEALIDGAPAKQLRRLEIETQVMDSRVRCDGRAASTVFAVVYMSYHLGMDSTTVAEELRILPPHVRQILYKLNHVAADLKTGRPYKVRTGIFRKWTSQELIHLWFLRLWGYSFPRCSKVLNRYACRAVYVRHFERPPAGSRKQMIWTPARLVALWLMRNSGCTWAKIGEEFGKTPAAVQSAYRLHLSKAPRKARNVDCGSLV